MTARNLMKPGRLVLTVLIAICSFAVAATAASAKEVIYNNQNTVPKVGTQPEDTYSQCYEGCGLTSAGALVEFGGTNRELKTITAEVDSFKCEIGVYYLESCRTKPPQVPVRTGGEGLPPDRDRRTWGPARRSDGHVQDPLPADDQRRMSEDRGRQGVPEQLRRRRFSLERQIPGLLEVELPNEAIIELVSPSANGYVNLGQEEAYKEYVSAHEEYVGLPGSGKPEIGKNPLANDMFQNGVQSKASKAHSRSCRSKPRNSRRVASNSGRPGRARCATGPLPRTSRRSSSPQPAS